MDTAQFRCNPKLPIQSTRCGEITNCASALLIGFPNFVGNGGFHRGTPHDVFELPRSSIEGDCSVTVDLINGDRPLLGSWAQVWTLVSTLNTACAYYMYDQRGPRAFTGGVVLAGRDNRLSVTVERVNMADNSTTA
ncbi:MAG: hypothetical protein Q9178_007222 [Gyalolechia marmorata]